MATVTTSTVALNNSTAAYTVPADARKVTFWSATASTNFRGTSASGTVVVMPTNQVFSIEDRNLPGTLLYFNHASTATVYVFAEFGLGS